MLLAYRCEVCDVLLTEMLLLCSTDPPLRTKLYNIRGQLVKSCL